MDGDAGVGLDDFDKLIDLQPNHWWGHFLAGIVAQREGDGYLANRHLTKAAETSTSVAWPHLLIAGLYADEKVLIEARAWLRKALERET